MKISARNMLPGTVKSVTPGAVNTEVAIEIAKGIEIVSIITSDSVKRLALAPGKRAYAVIKASDVLIGAE